MALDKTVMYPGSFTEQDLFDAYTVTCPAGQYTLIGEYVVKADEAVGIGRGGYASQDQAIGHLFAKFFDNAGTPAQFINGKFRIMYSSSQNIPIGSKPVFVDVDLSAIATGETIPADRFPLPFENVVLTKDRKIQFFIYNATSAAVTLSKANSKAYIDATRALIA